MKKLTFILAATAVIALASCSKEKDCTCVSTVDGTEMGTTKHTIEDGDCSDMNTESTLMGISSKVSCTED